MKRTTGALLMSVGLILAMTTPVAARGRPQQPADPELVEVTMTGALASTCDDGNDNPDTITMERSGTKLLPADKARLRLDIPGVDSSRLFPSKIESNGFAGCHGEQLDGSASPYGGLGITIDENGAVTDLLWHFDYYLEFTDGPGKPRMEVMEHFTLSGHELDWDTTTSTDWDTTTSTVSGWFDVLYHREVPPKLVIDDEPVLSIDYEPVEGSPVFLEITFNVDYPNTAP